MDSSLDTGSRRNAWLELMFVVVPVSLAVLLGSVVGAAFTYDELVRIVERGRSTDSLAMAVLVVLAVVCALAGMIGLWSVELPRALGRRAEPRLRRWQRVALQLGLGAGWGLVIVMLIGMFQSALEVMSFVFLFLTISPIVLALRFVKQDREARAQQG
ncbi:MAG: hypothetical protein ACYTCU_08520 [Planctomycetota bacterium]|jgi:H+/Cl- antiporter ClcA